MPSARNFVDDQLLLSDADLSPVEQFRRQHHTAVLVIMFTDLKGSTELAELRGEVQAQHLREQHDVIVREVVGKDDVGRVVKMIGDAALCVFAEPTAAVERALELHARLARFSDDHPELPPLEVRIGMHLGQVAVDDTVHRDVFGRHVNRAKRIEELAHSRQVLVSLPVYDSARGWLAETGVAWHNHGEYRVKGIDEPVRVYEACGAGVKPRALRARRLRSWRWALTAAAVIAIAATSGLVVRLIIGPRQEIIVSPIQKIPKPDLDNVAPEKASAAISGESAL